MKSLGILCATSFREVDQVAQTLSCPHRALYQWRLSCGMERSHLAREIGHSILEIKLLETGQRGLMRRDWVAGELLTLGAPAWAVEALSRIPDALQPVETMPYEAGP